jgi:hypothetical protein
MSGVVGGLGSGFVGFRFPREVIVLAVRRYLRYGLSYRDVDELLAERGIEVAHVTEYRWVQRFTPILIERPGRAVTRSAIAGSSTKHMYASVVSGVSCIGDRPPRPYCRRVGVGTSRRLRLASSSRVHSSRTARRSRSSPIVPALRRGRSTCRRKTSSCLRSTMISTSFERSRRPRSASSTRIRQNNSYTTATPPSLATTIKRCERPVHAPDRISGTHSPTESPAPTGDALGTRFV